MRENVDAFVARVALATRETRRRELSVWRAVERVRAFYNKTYFSGIRRVFKCTLSQQPPPSPFCGPPFANRHDRVFVHTEHLFNTSDVFSVVFGQTARSAGPPIDGAARRTRRRARDDERADSEARGRRARFFPSSTRARVVVTARERRSSARFPRGKVIAGGGRRPPAPSASRRHAETIGIAGRAPGCVSKVHHEVPGRHGL